MQNPWLFINRAKKEYTWEFSVGENGIWCVKPMSVTVPQRPATARTQDEIVKVQFQNIDMNQELLSFFADCYLSIGKKSKSYINLKLVDSLRQPIETWLFGRVTPKSVSIPLARSSAEFDFSFESKEYRDFLRKIYNTYN